MRTLRKGLCLTGPALLLVYATAAQTVTQVTLNNAVTPNSGPAGITMVLTASGFPSGTITAANVNVTMTPQSAGAGPTATTVARAYTVIASNTRNIAFIVPSDLNGLQFTTTYLISISGQTTAGALFQSSNSVPVAVTPQPVIAMVTPSTVAAGQSVAVTIHSLYTRFVQNATLASFGDGIDIGGGGFTAAFDASAQALCRRSHTAPTIGVGQDQTVSLNCSSQPCAPQAAATLTGTVLSYSVAPGAQLTTQWSVFDGPGPVQFQDSSARITTATFTTGGTYTLEFTAFDGLLSSQQLMHVVVNPYYSGSGQVHLLTLTPPASGPFVTGTTAYLKATYVEVDGPYHSIAPWAGETVTFTVTGANPFTGNARTDGNGVATLAIPGATVGTDTVVATVSGSATSNTATVTWVAPKPVMSTSVVSAAFFPNDTSGVFNTPSTQPPIFTQSFPSLTFNPAAGTIPGAPSTVNDATRPFQYVSTAADGTYAGSIPAVSGSYQAGQTVLFSFSAVFQGSLNVPQAGDYTLNITASDGWILGVGNGATRNSGPMVGALAVTPFASLTTMAAYNQLAAPALQAVSIHFPAAGAYPFELDYTSGGGPKLTLVVSDASGPLSPATTLLLSPISVPTMSGSQLETFTVTAFNAGGLAAPDLPVTVTVTGFNPILRNVTTDGGHATVTYQGHSGAGIDTVQATATVNGATLMSNVVSVPWASAANTAPVVQVMTTSLQLMLPARAQLDALVTDDGLPSNSVTIAWSMLSGPGAVVFDNATQATTGASFSLPGSYVLQISASDGALTTTATVSVTVLQNVSWSTGPLDLPERGTVSGVVPIKLVAGITLAGGTLTYWPASNENDRHTLNGSTIGSGQIGTFDTTSLKNGSYFISLSAVDTAGHLQNGGALLTVAGDYKPGRVTATTTDLVVPAVGLALRIDRRYDSLDSGVSGDFGYGWSLGVNVDLQVDPVGNVTFTLGGRRRTFYLTPVPVFGGPFSGIGVYKPAFTGEPGFTGSLTASLDGCLIIDILLPMGTNWICASGELYSPQIYTYTDPNGTVYTIASTGALQSVQDLSGNLLTITAAGISSSNGLTVPFVRDGQGRITRITDTMGNQYLYGYDTSGNLVSVTYPGIATPAVFVYDGGHVLMQEKDRRGNVVGISTYDNAGRLQTITDGVGNKTQYAYDTSTNTTTVTDADGGTIVTVANAAGDPVSVTDPLGRTTAYTYDGNRNVLTRTDPMGKVWTYTYDTNGFKTSEKDPLGNISRTVYNQYGGPVTMTDAVGNVKTIAYDTSFRPVTITDSIGQIAGATYNTAGSIAALKDANGNSSQMTYDAQGNTTGVTDALSRTAGATYDALGERLTLADSLKSNTGYSYDAAGRLLATTLADGSSSSVTYDGNGNVATRVDALGRTTTYTYDLEDHLIQTVYPDGTSTSATYNWRGQVLTQTDQAGHVTKYEYDMAGQLLKTTVAYGTADAATTQSSYDAAGRRITSTDARGNVTKYVYDEAGRMTQTLNALSQITTYVYDAAGRQTVVTDALGRKTQSVYDARGRVAQVTYPDGTTTSSTYDGVGHVIASTDQAGQVTHYAFDAGGQMLSATDALNQVTRYGYDANGNRLSRTDANNHTGTYTYDVVNRMKTRTLPGGGSAESFSYNLTGTTASVTDFNGKTTTFGYDTMDRLLMRTPDGTFGEPAVTFTYTAAGRRLTMTDASGTTSYGYDSQDRPVSKTNGAGMLTFTYDAAGNRLTVVSSNANGTNVGYSYDELNRLKTVTDNGAVGAITTYSYDVAGNLSGTTLPNGVQITPQLDAMNRVTGLPVTSKPAANYNYSYGLVGNRLVASDSNGSSHYTYNSVYRLTEEAVSRPQLNGVLNYGLDAVGNRLSLLSTLAGTGSQTASYDANDRVTTNTYDGNGNTLTAGSRTFRYDSMDRMTNFNNGTAAMVYDGDGNRVSKTSGATATVYLVDEGNPTGLSQVVDEIVGGMVKRRYVYGLERISQTQAGVASYYGYDGHGDVRFLMDGTGTVTDTYDYDAWGNVVASTGTTPNLYMYQGEALDSETGLYYLRARYYDPLSGRFLSVDPMADEGEHPYTYAGADPVNGRDPTGTQDILEYRWLSPGPVTFIAVALLFSVEDLEAQGSSPTTPLKKIEQKPRPGRNPGAQCNKGPNRRLSIFYDGRDLKLFDDGDSCLVLNCPATTGVPGTTPGDQASRRRGPIPRGDYMMNPAEWSPGNPIRSMLGDWGNWRVPLKPVLFTNTYGRGEFFIHGGVKPGSIGCIDVDGCDNRLHDATFDYPALIPVSVRYTEWWQ